MSEARATAELLVVDPSVPDAATLLDGRRAGIEVLMLAAGGKALKQIADHLDGHAPLQALHILSHGESGTLFLAGEHVDASALEEQRLHLECIAAAMDQDATVYLYGCSVAAGTRGAGFLASLEASLDACVMASARPVGSATLGGAWQFPLAGHAGAGLAFAPAVQAAYAGLLASVTLTAANETPVLSAGDDTITASLANSLNAGDVIDGLGGNDTLIISAAQSVTLGATTLVNVESITITAGIVSITTNNATVAAGQTLTVDASANAATLNWGGVAETDGTFHLTGGSGNDTLTGGAGNDTISGGLGADRISPGEGNNTIYAGDGADFVYALAGADLIYAEGGNDGISGGGGNDTVWGGDGNDTIIGAAGEDLLYSDVGTDWIWAGDGADTVYGGSGNDTVSGDAGNDTLYGGDDSDLLRGLADNDVLYGEAGTDTLSGGAGTDTLSGGDGVDQFAGTSADLNGDIVADLAAGESIIVSGADLSALNGTAASATIDLGSAMSLALTGISAASGSFTAAYNGSSTTITLSATPANAAPVIGSDGGGATAALSAAENQLAVTTVAATDTDGDTLTYAVTGGDDQGSFSIDASTGVLSFAASRDHEAPTDSDTNNTYVVDVTVSDGNGGTDVQTITVTVTDANDATVITSDGAGATASVSAAENQSAVTTVTATDADGDTPVFSITGGTDQSRFAIDAATGALSFVTPPDFEAPTDSDTNNTYVVDVTASDGNGGTDVQTITVTATNANEAIAITSDGAGATAAVSAAEDQTAVTTVTATDADGDTPVFSITGGSDQAAFAIDAATGVLSFVAPPDFEAPSDSDTNNTYVVAVTASDGNGGTDVQTITVTVTSNNAAPSITSNGAGATASVSAAENQSAVTTVTATDADGDTPVFSITGGTDQARFAIDAATGALSFVAPPDFEAPTDSDTDNTYVVDVTASDGNGGTDVQTITVTVTNANEAIAIASNGAGATASVSAAERQTAVTTVTATDADGDTPVFSITGGSDQAKFAIDAATGALSFVAPPDFEAPTDSDTDNSYVVAVTASDGNGGTDVQTITVNVTNTNDAIAITSDGGGSTAALSAAENQSAVTTVTATDPDGETPVFSITGGSDRARFAIDASSGALSFIAPPNFEAPTDSGANNTYVVAVTASDGEGGTDVQTITVTVTNANDPMAITSNGAGASASVTVAENQAAVTTVTATDADGDTPVFSIAGGSDQSRFSIDAATGALSFLNAPDFEAPTDGNANNTYLVNVAASDGNGGVAVQAITVTVSNVDDTEPPPPVLDEDGDLPGLSDLNDTLAAALPATLNASDVIDGKLGFDTLILAAAQTVVLGPTTLTNFERIIVTAGIQDISTDDATVAAGMNLLLDATASADAIVWDGSAETDGTFRLLTGAGNDIVQGGQGGDVIVAGLGQDIVAGGSGNDAIDGGGGRDVVQFSGASRTDYSLRVSGGQVIFTQLGSAEDGVDTLANVEAMQFTASVPDAGPAGSIARLFDTLFDRAPTQAEADLWLERTAAGLPLRDIASAMLSSSEGQLLFSGVGNGAFVDSVYQQALGRPADATERSYWGGAIDSGGISRADAALLIADSDEKLALEAPLETDFNTTEIATFVRMYEALFDRRPDQAGINYWIGSNEAGNNMHQLAASILGTDEMSTTHGALNDQQFVDMLYQDGLERTASGAETGYWLGLLGNGTADRAQVLMAFVNSTEMLELIGPINTSNILV